MFRRTIYGRNIVTISIIRIRRPDFSHVATLCVSKHSNEHHGYPSSCLGRPGPEARRCANCKLKHSFNYLPAFGSVFRSAAVLRPGGIKASSGFTADTAAVNREASRLLLVGLLATVEN